MDRMVIVWCKKRRLYGVFGGLVGFEFGFVDCDYEEYVFENFEVDVELLKLLREREGQFEIEVNFEFDNIFDVVVNIKEGVQWLKVEFDDLIKNRDINELSGG